MKYEISIIIPVYNVENYIRQALESIVNQTIGLDYLEVLMIDDCSTDQSKIIIDEYASKYDNFTAIHLPANSGMPGKPRNIGIERAKGKYLMFLDSDDYYSTDICEKLYKRIVKENVDIVSCNFFYVFENRKYKNYSPFGFVDEIKIKSIDHETRLLQIPPSIWTKIIKKKFIEDNNINFSEGIVGEDLPFMLTTFLKANGIIYLNNYFGCNYNRIRDFKGDKSLSRDKIKKNLMGMIHAYIKTFDILKYHDHEEYFPKIFTGHLQFWVESFILSDLNPLEKRELLEEISFLFVEFKKFEVHPKKYLIPLFNYISNKKYDEAILLSETLVDLVKNQENQQQKLFNVNKQLAKLRLLINNIFNRTKKLTLRLNNNREIILDILLNKIKNPYIQLLRFNPNINYNNLTIIIPYRQTNDPDREMNLDITMKYLSKIGILNLIISEHSDNTTKDFLIRKYENMFESFEVEYTNAKGKEFNLSKALNNGITKSTTKYITTFDLDCITKKKNIDIALALLDRGYDVIHPFNRRITEIVDKEKFKEKYDFNIIKTSARRRLEADGGIVFWNKDSFISIGMKNEYFFGWGGEDNEIMVRASLCHLKQIRIDDTLYHLYHNRPQKKPKNNQDQLRKTKQLKNKKKCLEEINKWPWVIKAKKKFLMD
jgi:glycosyltransferase involved in cell wall biosynthesis